MRFFSFFSLSALLSLRDFLPEYMAFSSSSSLACFSRSCSSLSRCRNEMKSVSSIPYSTEFAFISLAWSSFSSFTSMVISRSMSLRSSLSSSSSSSFLPVVDVEGIGVLSSYT